MSVTFNSDTNPKIRILTETLLQMLGQTTLDLSNSSSFKLQLETRNGQDLYLQVIPLDGGKTPAKMKITNPANIVVPSGDPADLDGYTGTTTLVSSYKDITIPTPTYGGTAVPTTAYVGAIVTSSAGVPRWLKAIRLSNTQIRVFSDGTGYKSINKVFTASGTCGGGTGSIAITGTAEAVATDDVFFVEEVSAGGGAASHFCAKRAGANAITVYAASAAGAAVATNTSAIRVHKFDATAANGNTATGTLVAGAADITLANAVGERLIAKAETAAGTAANNYVAFRKSATEVTVHAVNTSGTIETGSTSTVRVYNMGAPDSVCGVCVAGTVTIKLGNVAGDLLSVREVVTGGGAAASLSVLRSNDTDVIAFASKADKSFENTYTGTVKVYNHGAAAVDTSTVRYFVIRP